MRRSEINILDDVDSRPKILAHIKKIQIKRIFLTQTHFVSPNCNDI